jgi:hypothetical protein
MVTENYSGTTTKSKALNNSAFLSSLTHDGYDHRPTLIIW